MKVWDWFRGINKRGRLLKYSIIWVILLSLAINPFIVSNSSGEEKKESQRPFKEKESFPSVEAKRVWNFANDLMKEGEYYRAITEYQRFISYYPESVLVSTASFNIGLAYFRGEKWDDAKKSFIEFFQEFEDDPLAPQALFLIAETDYRKGDYQVALTEYQEVWTRYPELETGQRAKYMAGWVLIKLKSWDSAQAAFNKIDSDSPFYNSAQLLGQEVRQVDSIPKKSPRTAGVLSALVPGSGQFYVGRYKDGVMALLVNGGFIGGSIEAFNSGQEVLGSLLIFLGFSWYTGNIYSAVNSAHKFNQDQQEGLINRLEREHGLYLRISNKMDEYFLVYDWRF